MRGRTRIGSKPPATIPKTDTESSAGSASARPSAVVIAQSTMTTAAGPSAASPNSVRRRARTLRGGHRPGRPDSSVAMDDRRVELEVDAADEPGQTALRDTTAGRTRAAPMDGGQIRGEAQEPDVRIAPVGPASSNRTR